MSRPFRMWHRAVRRTRNAIMAAMPPPREQLELSFDPLDNRALANLVGPLEANLRQIEAALDVTIAHRGGAFVVTGTPGQAGIAVEALERFYALAEKPLSVDDIQLGLIEISTRSEGA